MFSTKKLAYLKYAISPRLKARPIKRINVFLYINFAIQKLNKIEHIIKGKYSGFHQPQKNNEAATNKVAAMLVLTLLEK